MKERQLLVKTATPTCTGEYQSHVPKKAQMTRYFKKLGLILTSNAMTYQEPHVARWRQVSIVNGEGHEVGLTHLQRQMMQTLKRSLIPFLILTEFSGFL
jgi:hypothetical protein